MGYLETKRNAIMNSVASGGLTNLLDGVSYEMGYFDNSGNIVSVTTGSKQIVTDYIDVETINNLFISNIFSQTRQCDIMWVWYDSNKDKVSNRGRVQASNLTEYYYLLNKVSQQYFYNGTKYIRFSFATQGDIDVGVYNFDNELSSVSQANRNITI